MLLAVVPSKKAAPLARRRRFLAVVLKCCSDQIWETKTILEKLEDQLLIFVAHPTLLRFVFFHCVLMLACSLEMSLQGVRHQQKAQLGWTVTVRVSRVVVTNIDVLLSK